MRVTYITRYHCLAMSSSYGSHLRVHRKKFNSPSPPQYDACLMPNTRPLCTRKLCLRFNACRVRLPPLSLSWLKMVVLTPRAPSNRRSYRSSMLSYVGNIFRMGMPKRHHSPLTDQRTSTDITALSDQRGVVGLEPFVLDCNPEHRYVTVVFWLTIGSGPWPPKLTVRQFV